MAKEARVVHLQRDLVRLDMPNALRALNWMISTMNANNGFARKDGRHYYYHLVDSTQDLINHSILDEATLTACILHDSVEDIDYVTIQDIESEYGVEVAMIVDLVTKKVGVDYKDYENLIRYLQAILRNPKACLVKTSDRKHNFSTLYATSKKHELRQTEETERFFMPFFKEARKLYPEYSAYFHSAKTTIMPHMLKIKQAHSEEEKLKKRIAELEMKLEQERKRNNALEKKIKRKESEIA